MNNKDTYAAFVNDMETFEHIIQTLQYNFGEEIGREQIIFNNYLALKERFALGEKQQFVKYGFFHIQKESEENYPSFFTRLIKNNIYDKEKVITIMGYLTKSKVLWNKKYDKAGAYKSYSTKAGYGIADYWREYFKGIEYLKKSNLSDLTMFKLNQADSPYHRGTDLVEIKMFLQDYNTSKLRGKNTLQFIDYASRGLCSS